MNSTDLALIVHITSVIVAFGPLFVYPLLGAAVRRRDPTALRVLNHAKHVVARRIITPALPLSLLAGLYLADREHAFGKFWVIVPMVLIVLLMGLHRLILTRGYRRLSQSEAGEHPRDRELSALSRQIERSELVGAGLVLLAVVVMTGKPFA